MTNSLEPGNLSSYESTSGGPGWRWRLEDSSGNAVQADGGDQEFPSQSDAESWVGEAWRELLDAGVDAVTLFEGDREVYGPMSLHAT